MNILVTAIGSFAADIVIKTLKQQHHFVIGCDVLPKEWIADAFNVDEFAQAPQTLEKENYIQFILFICRKFDIQYVIPLTDPEVQIVAEIKDKLLGMGVCACVSDYKVTSLFCDKYKISQMLEKENLCHTIPTYLLKDINELIFSYPMLAKPRYGRSSRGVIKINSKAAIAYVTELAEDVEYVVQPYIKGNILAVDVVRSSDGSFVCVSRRELLRKTGAGMTVEIIKSQEIEEICRKISNYFGVIGAVNYEFIETREKLYFMEANPRFSGGVEFSHIAGYNVVANHLSCFTDNEIETEVDVKKMIIARKHEEYITKVLL